MFTIFYQIPSVQVERTTKRKKKKGEGKGRGEETGKGRRRIKKANRE